MAAATALHLAHCAFEAAAGRLSERLSDSGATPPNRGTSELIESVNTKKLDDTNITKCGHDQQILTSD